MGDELESFDRTSPGKRWPKSPTGRLLKLGPPIVIPPRLSRYDIVRQLALTFLAFERDLDRRGVSIIYPVEKLSYGVSLHLVRPGKKYGFDFKVEIPMTSGLQTGKQFQIATILRDISNSDAKTSERIWNMLRDLFHCRNHDIDEMLKKEDVRSPLADIEALLKVTKWMFVMEDVHYWFYEGRAFLFNAYRYVANEPSEEKARTVLDRMASLSIRPADLRRLYRRSNMEWIVP